MEISIKAKERFCKDCNIPIKVFQEPYFMDRMKLYDSFYDTIDKWENFINELSKYNNEQEYFEEYNKVKDAAISYIKESKAYARFNEEDMNKYSVKNKDKADKNIFKTTNDQKIDVRKANFSSLRCYDKEFFNN